MKSLELELENGFIIVGQSGEAVEQTLEFRRHLMRLEAIGAAVMSLSKDNRDRLAKRMDGEQSRKFLESDAPWYWQWISMEEFSAVVQFILSEDQISKWIIPDKHPHHRQILNWMKKEK